MAVAITDPSAVSPAAKTPLRGEIAMSTARTLARFELRCSSCSYSVIVSIAPCRCPMCQATVWEHP